MNVIELTEKPKHIILIDDDHGPMALYVQALHLSGYAVDHLDDVTEAIERIKQAAAPGLFIVDIMMPPGDSGLDLKETGYGLSTGLVLVRIIRAKHPHTPVIILTSVTSPDILASIREDEVKALSSEAQLPAEHPSEAGQQIPVLGKLATPPFTLVEKVKEILSR